MHALIIEDEMLIALEIEQLLRDLGYDSFDWADSPPSALACALGHRPDLITADLRIIGGTGIDAVNAITDELGPLPVVYVTANADMLRGEPGAKVVSKPIQPRRLAEACAF
jgi:CheY-like chemotaxis protein